MKILVVDDDGFALQLLDRQLANLGFSNVVSCNHAREALTRLESDAAYFGLVFCDLQMPEIDGVEFVRQLVRIGYRGGLALVSGEDERVLRTAERLARAHHLDVLGALHKPVTLSALQGLLSLRHASRCDAPESARHIYTPQQLRAALDGNQLINHYQPKVSLASGELVGVESLVRWQHPDDGLVEPEHFVGIAEKHGLIDDLTRVVLVTALRHGGAWHAGGLPLQVAVNISMENLGVLDFPDMVEREAAAAGMPLTHLVLEVTESCLMKDPLSPLDILTRLRLKRIGLSIDDFGTGHSSLAQLRDIPFTELKIDRSFVHGASRNSYLQVILEASLAMARQLGMKTVAEGMEERADWNLLRTCSCDVAQGYLVGKPMPAADLPAWLREWEGRRGELTSRPA
ncbi:EAL domain-containing response regulator [Janthinobacterium sp. 17J80-10]|uniref:EAL domain-containing response regulator n=1 Tax=Janthinobacterium sp. 17J80-10 TaxID=2497863 RepID=UPI0010058CD4|nr:EAL domain-containing response regulator [Janthinobacterium sp. 17J80-10]QAU32743.1 EAL domain-containing protein [Janthinobacterium sp. 17J80-10]